MNKNNGISKEYLESLKKAERCLTQIKLGFSSKEEQEQALQNKADEMSLLVSSDEDLMSRYRENLSAFKEYYPEIYE
ncbi:MAG: hypothetical protein RPR97_06945, partial [Colwellia sp.]